MQLGLALTGASMSIAVAGGGTHLNATSAACIIGGVAVALLALGTMRAAFTGIGEAVVLIRFATAALVLALLPVAVHVPVAVLLTALAALLAISIMVEAPAHRRRMRAVTT